MSSSWYLFSHQDYPVSELRKRKKINQNQTTNPKSKISVLMQLFHADCLKIPVMRLPRIVNLPLSKVIPTRFSYEQSWAAEITSAVDDNDIELHKYCPVLKCCFCQLTRCRYILNGFTLGSDGGQGSFSLKQCLKLR